MISVFVTGVKGCGKTTFTNYIYDVLNNVHNIPTEVITIAKPLKEMVFKLCKLFDVDINSIDDLENPETKEIYRNFMQQIGTEICQNIFGKECWCKAVMNNNDLPTPLRIISDLRFEHEFQYFHKMSSHSIVIRINKTSSSNNTSTSSCQSVVSKVSKAINNFNNCSKHISENFDVKCLEKYSNVYVINIDNNSDLQAFHDLAEDIVSTILDLYISKQ